MPAFLTRSVILSLILHGLVMLVGLVGWPFLQSEDISAQPLVVIDVVSQIPQHASPAAPKDEPKGERRGEIEREETRRQPQPPPPPPPPPTPQAGQKSPESDADPKAEILPENLADIPKAPPKQAQPKQVQIAVPLSRPNKLAQESRQKQKAQALHGTLQQLADVTLAKKADKNQKAESEQDRRAETVAAAIGAAGVPKQQNHGGLSLADINKLRAHIATCWQPPVGGQGADKLKVYISLAMHPDGTIRQAIISDQTRYAQEDAFRIAANAARRAVLQCQPLPLPVDKYELWKISEFGFDPKFMR